MPPKSKGRILMNTFFNKVRTYIFRGFVAIIPIFLCYLAVRLLYTLIDTNVIEFINRFVAVRHIPGLGILLVLVALFLIGLIVGNFVGRSIFKFIENISERIPVIKFIYGIGKQISQSLNLDSEKSGFKKAVLVRFGNSLVPGFLSGSVSDQTINEERTLVFVPTAPSPTQGFVFAVKKGDIIDPGWSVEECWKVVVSAGIIAPKQIQKLLE